MWGQGVVFPVLDHTWSPGTDSWICSTRGNGTLSYTNLVTWFMTFPSCSICCEISSPLTWGKCVDTCFTMGGAFPSTIFYREETWDREVILSLSRAVGKKSPQEQSVSKIHLERVSLHVQLVHSTIPELGGRYAVCNFHLMLKVLLTCYTKSAMKAGPLSNPMLVGNPNLGTVSLSRHQATFDALPVWVGKASPHPENVHTVTSRYWLFQWSPLPGV